MIVALDASPLSLLTQRKGVAEADACRAWADSLVLAGVRFVIPAISDYEVRRELIRSGKAMSVKRLDALRTNAAFQFLSITDDVLIQAAFLWADARRRGLPTAAASELDCDVVMVAILQTNNLPQNELVIATSNVGHLSRFLAAKDWKSITP
jgi:predicted nucleic acid-binding protein